ncbi:MAG: Wzz/FepE/Etk N-terminal domain-containing protein [Myxococcota bacterium]
MARPQDMDDEAVGAGRPGAPVDLMRLLRVLWRGRKVLVLVGFVGAIVGVGVAKAFVKNTYSSGGAVLYVGTGDEQADPTREFSSLTATAYSDRYLRTLRERQGLGDMPLVVLRNVVMVGTDPQNGLFTFNSVGQQPTEASRLANAAIELFVEMTKERRRERLETERASLDARIEAATNELAAAREAYDTFRTENGISEAMAGSGAVSEQAGVRAQANLARAEFEAKEAEVARLRAALEFTPQTTTGVVRSSMASARIAELRQRLAEARGQGLGEEHPRVRSLRRQVEALEAQQTAVTTTRRNRTYVALEKDLEEALSQMAATRQRADALERLAARQSSIAGTMSEVETAAAGLLAEVNVKTTLLQELAERSTAVEDLLRNVPTGLRVVSRATPPEFADPSKKKKIVALAVPLALGGLAVLLLLLREFRRFRLISAREVAWWGNGPVVGASAWPRRQTAIHELVTDLQELLEGARGQMLVVGLSEHDAQCARRLLLELDADAEMPDTVLVDDPGSIRPPPRPPAAGSPSVTPPSRGTGTPREASTSIVLSSTTQSRPPRRSAMPAPPAVPLVSALELSVFESHGGLASLRSVARRADGVLVVVSSGVAAPELAAFRKRLGVENVGFVLLNMPSEAENDPDRFGNVEEFLDAFAV